MKRISLSSTTMLAAGYDADKKILEIQFVSGDVYQYFDVPLEIYNRLLEAESYGHYFNYNIRDNYSFLKVS